MGQLAATRLALLRAIAGSQRPLNAAQAAGLKQMFEEGRAAAEMELPGHLPTPLFFGDRAADRVGFEIPAAEWRELDNVLLQVLDFRRPLLMLMLPCGWSKT